MRPPPVLRLGVLLLGVVSRCGSGERHRITAHAGRDKAEPAPRPGVRRWLAPSALVLSALGIDGQPFVGREPKSAEDRDPDKAGAWEMNEHLQKWHKELYGTSDVDGFESSQRRDDRDSVVVPPGAMAEPSGAMAEPHLGLASEMTLSPKFDTDGDGRVSRSEYMNGFGDTSDLKELLSVDPASWLEDFYSQADGNNDGYLDPDEVQRLMGLMEEGLFKSAVGHEMVEALDMNSDGSIGVEEIRDALANTNDPEAHLALEHLLEQFSQLDVDGDMALSKEEAATFADRLLGFV